jgi:hypothetical protein
MKQKHPVDLLKEMVDLAEYKINPQSKKEQEFLNEMRQRYKEAKISNINHNALRYIKHCIQSQPKTKQKDPVLVDILEIVCNAMEDAIDVSKEYK